MSARIGGVLRGRRLAALCLALGGALATACGGSQSSAGADPANLSIAPSAGFAGAAVPVSISGANFLIKVTQPSGGGTPTVDTQHRAWLGSVELADVTWVNANSLQATVPAGLAAGTYDLTVENALGGRGTASSAYVVEPAPSFSATATLDHPAVSVGQDLTLTLSVVNGGAAIDALAIGLPTVSSSDGGSARPGSASWQPTPPPSMAAGETLTFTYAYEASTAGHVSVTVAVTGTDRATGSPLTASLAAPAQALIVNPLTVVASPAGSGSFTCSGTDVAPDCTGAPTGAQVTVQETPSASYAFSGWSGVTCTGGQAGSSCTFTMPDAPTTVTGTFAPAGEPLAITPPSHGTISCNSGSGSGACQATYVHGTTVTLTATPGTGYSFTAWTGDCSTSTTATCRLAMTAPRSVGATFSLRTFLVTPHAGAHGTISPSTPQTVGYGLTTSFTVTPAAGHKIGSVTGCGGSLSGSTYTTGPITSSCTVSATFPTSP
jgi:hypothetical protein